MNALFLALGSFCVYAIASNVAAQPFFTNALRRADTSLFSRNVVGILFELARFGFYVGVPFLALLFGWIHLRAMGLGFVDWAEGLRWAIVILLAAWLLLMVIWLPYLRATSDVLTAPDAQRSIARRLVEMIYMQAHWAFYRAAMIVFLQGAIRGDEGYWGAGLGLALVGLEAFTNPRIRQQLTRIGEADTVVWNAGQAVLNTFAFIVTRNFYLLLLIHFLLEFSIPHLRATSAPRAYPTPAPRAQNLRE